MAAVSPAPGRSLLVSVMRTSGQEFNFLDGSIADVINILSKIALSSKRIKQDPQGNASQFYRPHPEKELIRGLRSLLFPLSLPHCSRTVLLREWSGNSEL